MKYNLTPTQILIVNKLSKGHTRKTVCQHLSITESTLSVHLSNICKRINLSSFPRGAENVVRRFGVDPRPLAPVPLRCLSDGMRDVLALRAQGKSLAEIAGIRRCTVSTIANHIHQVYRRLGLLGMPRVERAKRLREFLSDGPISRNPEDY